MDITKFFNSKKRYLSNNSNTEEDAKRQHSHKKQIVWKHGPS